MRARLYWPVTLAAAALVGLLAYGLFSQGTDDSIDQAIRDGRPVAAPVASLPKLGAEGSASLADFRGRPVVLNVWASWCKPCLKEMPLLEKVHRRMSAAGGTVLGVNVQDDRVNALAFLRENGITFPSVRDRDRTYVRSFGVNAYPETFLIDRDGRVVSLFRGAVTQQWLDRELPKVLS